MNVPAKLVEKVSKAGKPYLAIVISITPTYEKIVFLDTAEIELLKMTQGK